MDIQQVIALGLGVLILVTVGGLMIRFHLSRRRADRVWAAARYPKLKDIGTVKHLTILPLIDRHTARDPSTSSGQVLVGEAGVSYLVRADDTTILFDLGLNERGEHPSPLLRNMEALGVNLKGIDFIVISHLRLDHVGGMEYQQKRTFSLSSEPLDLSGITAFVPVPMTHFTARVEVVRGHGASLLELPAWVLSPVNSSSSGGHQSSRWPSMWRERASCSSPAADIPPSSVSSSGRRCSSTSPSMVSSVGCTTR